MVDEINQRGPVGTFFLGPRFEERDVNGPAAGVIPPARENLTSLSVEQALGIGAVYRCVSIITSAISQMPLGVYRNGVEIDSPTIIKQPNIDTTLRTFLKDTAFSLATTGNFYWRQYGDYPTITNLEVLDPNAVSILRDNNGRKEYWFGDQRLRNVKHGRLMTKPGQDKGFGPIQQGQSELIGAEKVRRFADDWFGGSGVPTGMLTTDQRLNATDAANIADAWAEFLRNHGIPVMHSGLRFETLNIKPADAQYLEVQQSYTVAIARLFGVPATLLASGNEGNSNTYSNQQELFQQFLMTTLVDYMNEIEDALSSLLPRGQVVNFKEDALLRMNTVMETEVAVAQVNAGLITPNEWREARGLKPISAPKPQAPVAEEDPNKNIGDDTNGTDS